MYVNGQAVDEQLLAIFNHAVQNADRETAFRRIEDRYALLVWRTVAECLGEDDPQVGEAVTATFIVFSRRAGSIRHPLSQWLRQTAKRTAYHVAA